MRTLTTLEQPPLHVTNSSNTWNLKHASLLLQTSVRIVNQKQTWRLHAEAKGFSRAPPNNKTNGGKKNMTRKSNNDDEDDEKIPEAVWKRMISRILLSVGVPLVFGIVLLQVFGLVKEQHLWDVPIWLPYLTTFITFGSSALGVAYGTLSTSLDPETEGSVMGFQEAQQNWVEMWRQDEKNSS